MSSPAAAPTPTSMAGKEPTKAPTRAPTNPSTPAAQPTPSSLGQNNFLSPNAGRVAGKTLGKTLAAQHSSPAVSNGTPNISNVVATFDSPSFVGMEPGSSSMGLSMSGLGLGMGLSASALGASSSTGRLDDAQRRHRLEAVLATLGQRPGRVSQAGLERLARKLGMEMYSEVNDRDRLMTLAGGAYAIDVTFRPDDSANVAQVALQFHGLCDAVSEKAPAAAAILHEDLQSGSGLPSINLMLDRFANNLERLSRLDRLSVTGANCFEAISGVHASLQRLYEHEKKTAEAIQDTREPFQRRPELAVMTKKSGRPGMHVRHRVGLSLDYWKDRRLVPSLVPSRPPNGDEMQVDDTEDPASDDRDHDQDGMYSLILECEHCAPTIYPSIRITNDWLAPEVTKPADADADPATLLEAQSILAWTDPPAPLIAGVEPDPMSATAVAQSTHPQARFIAHLEPSVVLPLSTAAQVMASVGVDISQEFNQTPAQQAAFDGFVWGRARAPQTTRRVTTFDSEGEKSEQSWECRTYVSRAEFGREMSAIPFAHPRQLLPILPILRQYALFTKLLRSAYPNDAAGSEQSDPGAPKKDHKFKNARSELEDLLNSFDTKSSPAMSRVLDIILLQATPTPRISVTLSAPGGPCSFTIDSLPNGELNVDSDDATRGSAPENGTSSGQSKKEAWTRALATCEDLALWAEWMRQHILDGAKT